MMSKEAMLAALLVLTSREVIAQEKSLSDLKVGESISLPAELDAQIRELSDKQASALVSATAKILRAYNYNGFSYIEPIDGAKLVAVDVEIVGRGDDFDLDDIDIIDGDTQNNYGSDPHISLLTSQGNVELDQSKWPKYSEPLRVLLIYAMPNDSKSIKLEYWGQILTPSPILIKGKGPILPAPTNSTR